MKLNKRKLTDFHFTYIDIQAEYNWFVTVDFFFYLFLLQWKEMASTLYIYVFKYIYVYIHICTYLTFLSLKIRNINGYG